MSDWHTKYDQRINSPEWKMIKYQLIEQRGSKCEKCKESKMFLELHHITYDRLGRELPSDLLLLCHDCHVIADKERAVVNRRRGIQRAEITQYNNAYDTYVSKKYGDNYYDDESTRQEFDEWLEHKERENY